MKCLEAVQHIRSLRGGAQSHLMLASDGNLYVVKFQGNPQGTRTLFNEYFVTRLGDHLGLSVQPCTAIDVSQRLIECTPDLTQQSQHSRYKCQPGLQFGSRFAGGLMPGHVVDYLPSPMLAEVTNLHEFPGVLALDKWTSNADTRQAVFVRGSTMRRYKAFFIDHGLCLNGKDWYFRDIPAHGVFPRNEVYAGVTGWHSFEPWLQRIQDLTHALLEQLVSEIPHQWYNAERKGLDLLLKQLFLRRVGLRNLIADFRDSYVKPFSNWGKLVNDDAPEGDGLVSSSVA